MNKCFANKDNGRFCVALKPQAFGKLTRVTGGVCDEDIQNICPFYKSREQALAELEDYIPPKEGCVSKEYMTRLVTSEGRLGE